MFQFQEPSGRKSCRLYPGISEATRARNYSLKRIGAQTIWDAKTFKPAAELRALLESKRITPDREVNT
jgi:hypothetical protein